MSTTNSVPKNIVIIGGGIIGCTTAYYLSRHPQFQGSSSTITLLEPSAHGAAHGASGKAGGLVAKWAYPKELARVSFAEHVRLAQEHNGADRWGWRFVGCGSWTGRGDLGTSVGNEGKSKSLEKTTGLDEGWKESRTAKGLPDDLGWVEEELTDGYTPMAPDGATAQVHPYLFTTSMLNLAMANGVVFVRGKATSINQSTGKITGVTYSDPSSVPQTIPATDVILAAGAWSPSLVPRLPISATRAHSITIRPTVPISPYVLFTDISLPTHNASPEIYPRPTNEVYACGSGDDEPLPPSVDDVAPDPRACERIHAHVSAISRELRQGAVDARQACFLPVVTTGGGPIVGAAPGIAEGLVIAAGHTCWGICNAPGTAKAISELVMEGKIRCANLKSLDPARFL